MKINQTNIKLTDNEKKVMQAILEEGYYDDDNIEDLNLYGSVFFGYEVHASDVNNEFNPSGVVASLVKKGIIDAGDAGGIMGYWLKYELEINNGKIVF